jgi:uncharacterized protein YjbJ (UPF0337 family)
MVVITGRENKKQNQFMTKLEIKGDLNIIKGKLKQKQARLTENKLQGAEGKSEELLGRIQKHTSKTREAIKKAVPPRASLQKPSTRKK